MTRYEVDWDAVAAIASVGVLAWGVWEATAQQRSKRMRDAALLRALVVVSRGTAVVLERRIAEVSEQNMDPLHVANALLSTGGLDVAQKTLDGVMLQDLPSPAAVDALMSARAGIMNATAGARWLTEGPNRPIQALEAGRNALQRASDQFEREEMELRRFPRKPSERKQK